VIVGSSLGAASGVAAGAQPLSVNARAAEVASAMATFFMEIDICLLFEFVGFSRSKFTARAGLKGEAGAFASF
jgi:hypothetical protein